MQFPFTCLEINGLTPDNVERVCLYAKRFNISSIGYMSAEWDQHQFLDHTEWGVPPVNEEARSFMDQYQRTIRAASERVSAHGLDFYLWRRDLRLPSGFVEKYGLDWINFENPQLWELLRWNTKAIFKLFPAAKGIFLSCTGERKAGEWITANGVGGNLPLWQRFEKMFRTVKETCDSLGRTVVFRNHGAGGDAIPLVYDESTYMYHFLKAAAAVGKDVILMSKSVEPDYQAGYPFNAILAPMAQQQPTYVEFSLPMEYNAVGRTPFPMVEDIRMRVRKSLESGCQGAVARIDWHMTGHRTERTWSCLDTFNEINAYAFGRFINAPATPALEIYEDFAKERFGEAARATAVAIFKDLYEAGCKTYYELGAKGCGTPSGAPLPPDSLIFSLRKHHIFRWSLSPVDYLNQLRALEPDLHFLTRVEEEKNQALALYRNALSALISGRDSFRGNDASSLKLALERAYHEAEIRREYMVAFYAWMAFDNTGDPAYQKIAFDRLKALEPLVASFLTRYDPMEPIDPDAGDVFRFGVNTTNAASKLLVKLEVSRIFWENQHGVAVRTRYSGIKDGVVEIPLGSGHISIEPDSCTIIDLMVDGKNLLKEPVPLVIYRVGGLEERGSHLGRSFYKVRSIMLENGLLETQVSLAHYQGINIVFRTKPGSDAILIRCSHTRMPDAGTLEFPWMQGLSSQPQDVPGEEWQDLLTALDIQKPAIARKYSTGMSKDIVLLDVTYGLEESSATTKDGLLWKVPREAFVTCVLVLTPSHK